jgi:Ribbon-helix-helix domain
MAKKERKRKRAAKGRLVRKGKPLTVYFSTDLAARLEATSRERHVPKSHLIRFAIDQLLNQLGAGQLDLPLGIR